MWSGPRRVSTALMRSWENRPDTIVVDEPLYAFYLKETASDHPGRDEVIASQPTDWRTVLHGLAEDPLPPDISVYYAKHMTHHLLPAVARAATARVFDQGPALAPRLLRARPLDADSRRSGPATAGGDLRGLRRSRH